MGIEQFLQADGVLRLDRSLHGSKLVLGPGGAHRIEGCQHAAHVAGERLTFNRDGGEVLAVGGNARQEEKGDGGRESARVDHGKSLFAGGFAGMALR